MRERVPGQRRLQIVLQILRGHPEPARLRLIDLEVHRALGGLVPIELHVARVRIVPHAPGEIVGDLDAPLAICGPVTRNCTGKPTGGPFSSRLMRVRRLE